jgi:hypothetical protein
MGGVSPLFFMKTFIFFIAIISLWSCTANENKGKNEITLVTPVTFKLDSAEKVKRITKQQIYTFGKMFSTQNLNVPLLRYVEGSNYEIFIGIPIGDDSAGRSSFLESGIENGDTVFYSQEVKGEVLTGTIYKRLNGNLFSVSVKRSAAKDSVFHWERWSNRLSISNE